MFHHSCTKTPWFAKKIHVKGCWVFFLVNQGFTRFICTPVATSQKLVKQTIILSHTIKLMYSKPPQKRGIWTFAKPVNRYPLIKCWYDTYVPPISAYTTWDSPTCHLANARRGMRPHKLVDVLCLVTEVLTHMAFCQRFFVTTKTYTTHPCLDNPPSYQLERNSIASDV